ncbi:O-methyltransferase-domain-containing protein [Xylaria telfairii]|nr:O-methyltransferase-domain-containing protein [Xylaria telfairii]
METTKRDDILEHAAQIKQLVHDPNSFLTELVVQQQQYHCIAWLCHFDVLSYIPLPPSSIPYSTVAEKGKLPISKLKSISRMAMTSGFLVETDDGNLSHNSLSAPFIRDIHLKTQLLHMFTQTVPLMRGMAPATEKWGDTVEKNKTAYNYIHQTDLPFFKHLESRADLSKGFDNFMRSRAVSHTGSKAEYLLESFDWSSLGKGIVVDVGGSSGSTAIMLAKANPELNLIVEDLSGPIGNAKARISELSKDIGSRIDAIEHNFFSAQPVKGADIYLLRTILHDWADPDAVKILKEIVDAMTPSSCLLIMDMILPKPGSVSSIYEAALRQKDLTMIQTFNAKEREEDEWRALLTKADTRLRIDAIKRPAGSELSVIVAVLDPTIKDVSLA